MVEDFIKYSEEYSLFKGGRVLLAVSGGIDSMVMAHIFSQTGIPASIAHCNFCLRGKESEGDEKMVRKFAVAHDYQFHSKRFDTKGFAVKNGISIQMAARELRYEWFEELRRKNGYESVAVAHNLNDNIETLLINLTRGTGITGLTGMKVSANMIIRPLLFATRKTIAEYSEANKVKFREDRSNAETKYTRNKIRHLVIPVLKEINPSVETTLNETAGRLAAIDLIVNYFTQQIRESAIREEADGFHVDIKKLVPFEDNATMLFELFSSFGMTGTGASDLKNIIAGTTGGQIFTQKFRFLRNRNEILITENKDDNYSARSAGSVAAIRRIPGILSARVVNRDSGFPIPDDSGIACLDPDKVKFPVTFRKWKAGDYFYPLGMKKRKKLSDYFIDRKLSRIEKENIVVMESGGELVWIIGERIDDRFRITGSTKKALIIKSGRK